MSAQRTLASLVILLFAFPLFGQIAPEEKTHDIALVDVAPPDGIISIPLPMKRRGIVKKYEVPELVGARQALGSQLIDGELPKPLLDYRVRGGDIEQRLSIFEGGLAVVTMKGTGTMRKRVILPDDAVAAYRRTASPDAIAKASLEQVPPPLDRREGLLRAYRDDGSYVELKFDPSAPLPKPLGDPVSALDDLLRVLAEDRTVTNTVAGYAPHAGDELVADDRRVWRVVQVMDGHIVEMRCTTDPAIIYIDKDSMHQYFIGRKAPAQP